jgi:hypothetical protein
MAKREIKLTKKTIFFPPKYEKYAEIISVENPEKARGSVRQMLEEFEKARTRDKRRRIKKTLVLAANRARVMSENPRLSEKERKEAKEVYEIYKNAYEKLKI